MKVFIALNENNTIIWREDLINEREIFNPDTEKIIDVPEIDFLKIQVNATKYINEQLDFSQNDPDFLEANIRFERWGRCFCLVNRGQVWYNTLTEEQKEELQVWYQGWLDAPATLIVPERPSWLKLR